ncbi:MAG: MarC family protein [Alphaproteobacteria bacterium]
MDLYSNDMEFFIKVFSTYFVILGPIDLMVLFAILTRRKSRQVQKEIAFKGCHIAFWILLFFTFFGSWLVQSIGISISALKTSGGLLLMVVAYDMIFGSSGHSTDYGEDEQKEAQSTDDISVFPLATPLLAGAGAMSASILFSAESNGSTAKLLIVIISFTLVLVISYVLFVMASRLQKRVGVTFTNIITRVMGILLSALALQFIFDGLKQSGLF